MTFTLRDDPALMPCTVHAVCRKYGTTCVLRTGQGATVSAGAPRRRFTLRDAATLLGTLVGMALVVAAWVALFAVVGVVVGP